jgi:hypothetical protein
MKEIFFQMTNNAVLFEYQWSIAECENNNERKFINSVFSMLIKSQVIKKSSQDTELLYIGI